MEKQTQPNDTDRTENDTTNKAGLKITRRHLPKALAVKEITSGKDQIRNLTRFLLHYAIDALEAESVSPPLDLGLGALYDLSFELEASQTLMAGALRFVEAQAPGVLNQIKLVLVNYSKEAQAILEKALAPLTASDDAQVKEAAQAVRGKAQSILETRCQLVPRKLTGGEVLDVLRGDRALKGYKLISNTKTQWVPRKQSQASKDGKLRKIALIDGRIRMAKLLSSLNIYSEENFELALDWGVDFGFKYFDAISVVSDVRNIVSGNSVHVSSVKPADSPAPASTAAPIAPTADSAKPAKQKRKAKTEPAPQAGSQATLL